MKENKSNNHQQLYLYIAWVTSIIAMLGSLYFSEFRGFVPCELCWYQRILMYPLPLILGIATFFNDKAVKKYVLPMSIIGLFIAIFHYLEQKVPGFASLKPCSNGIPCSGEYINWLGFITIPFLSLTAFTIITIMMFLIRKK
ncbi:disulfide oxidoreductase [Bacillus carboniphilus]|uniref:Probable disulfide formation protein n=1 Tax=Bacillus carboniphilus TaxID=86663 RepID=A0ABY9JRR9_9BACI|nr:disulfide oxidoreductase [Bacillus carboniphilus]WLR42100.1 disulfide oxidoreductase [Bacillus carboniphilus]